ncbi:hypothetical protein GCM10022243_11440 [Saccharothrix violaceirubra]|uniref:Uncharacterized protein n=1 Tax=Saccharothrix violaceirubra TaxID=413306 RepID=A0A7W7WYP0_9PSEU|nr:hypothetical protein [Saccharothrix violaceirubra]MBB4968645.1 hypothetical protein [Saccharothrix violaceirubra]
MTEQSEKALTLTLELEPRIAFALTTVARLDQVEIAEALQRLISVGFEVYAAEKLDGLAVAIQNRSWLEPIFLPR